MFEKQLKIRKNLDFWQFAETELLDGLYWEELYNKGRRVTTFKCPITEELANGPCPVPYTDRSERGREVSEPELVQSSHFPLITGTDILRLLVGQTEQHATYSNLQI